MAERGADTSDHGLRPAVCRGAGLNSPLIYIKWSFQITPRAMAVSSQLMLSIAMIYRLIYFGPALHKQCNNLHLFANYHNFSKKKIPTYSYLIHFDMFNYIHDLWLYWYRTVRIWLRFNAITNRIVWGWFYETFERMGNWMEGEEEVKMIWSHYLQQAGDAFDDQKCRYPRLICLKM